MKKSHTKTHTVIAYFQLSFFVVYCVKLDAVLIGATIALKEVAIKWDHSNIKCGLSDPMCNFTILPIQHERQSFHQFKFGIFIIQEYTIPYFWYLVFGNTSTSFYKSENLQIVSNNL